MRKRWQTKDTTRIIRVARCATRGLMVVIVVLVLVGSAPTRVQAADNPVDLELGGEGATPWMISNLEPGDSGIKMVELHNAGSKDGFVTIWVSDIISSEGTNPESETGDNTEPGEFTNYLLLDLTAKGLGSNVNLPAKINNLPQNASGPDYIEIIPLKAGDTVFLRWDWELLTQAGNNVQGDDISFSINYLLQECSITDVSAVVTGEGVFTEEVTAESKNGKGELTIAENTTAQTKEGEPLSEIWIIEIDKVPPAPPANTKIVGSTYDLGPGGATFDPPITFTSTYDPSEIPAGANEEDLVIALWDEDADEWVELEDSIVDTVSNTISVPVSQFNRFIIIAPVPLPRPEPTGEEYEPPAPAPPPPLPPPTPTPTPVEEAPPTTPVLEINILGNEERVEIGTGGILHEPLRLTDRSGNFIIDIDSGTKVTGSDNMELSRIELTITEESIVVPDDIVVLSPIYKLTGYTQNMEATWIYFEPSARLTISYDPRDLPEDTFPPFIVNYTDDEGLVRLQLPLGSLVEIGKAKAEINRGLLFAVVAQLAPPPPPLPAKFKVSNLIINPGRTQLGEPIIISLTIVNEGETTGSYQLYLKIDGIVRAVEETVLAANNIETISFEVANLAIGKHEVKVAGLTGQFRIVSTAAPPVESIVDWLVIDLSIGAGLVVSLLVLYLFRHRL